MFIRGSIVHESISFLKERGEVTRKRGLARDELEAGTWSLQQGIGTLLRDQHISTQLIAAEDFENWSSHPATKITDIENLEIVFKGGVGSGLC
jgi:hypothetical protein